MFSGNGLALVIPFLIAPLISRLYTPEDFAGFELFVKIATLLGVVAAFRFELAIILPKSENEARQLTRLSLRLVVIVGLVAGSLAIPFRHSIARILDNSDLAELLWLLPLAVICFGFLHVFTQYALRLKKFGKISSTKISGAIVNHGYKYVAGLNAPIALSLVWGQIFGLIIPILDFLRIKSARQCFKEAFYMRLPSKALFRKYRDFPLVSASHGFFDEGQKALLLFLISAYYGETVIGLFAFGLRYLKIPLQVMGVSVSQVLNEKWARDLNENKPIQKGVIKTGFALFGIGIIPFSLLFFFGEELFSFVFGSDWRMAGLYSEYMSIWLFLNFVVSPMSFLPVLLEQQRTNFLIAIIGNTLTLIILFWMSINNMEFISLLIVLVICNVILSIFVWVWYIRIAGTKRIGLI
jgi:O-antigen/teichoic acid export membrane protein